MASSEANWLKGRSDLKVVLFPHEQESVVSVNSIDMLQDLSVRNLHLSECTVLLCDRYGHNESRLNHFPLMLESDI